jgi:hypothetical protein
MKPYGRFYVLFAGSIIVFCALWVLGVYAQLGVPVSEGNRWRYVHDTFKRAHAESIGYPKLIVMSGSNGEGIDAEKLGKNLEIPSANMAATDSIGLEYILYRTWPVVQSGDWILAPLEYSLYGKALGGEKPVKTCIDYALAYDPGYFRTREPIQKAKFITAISMWRFFEGLLRVVFPLSKTLEEQPPLPLGENGDETDNIGQNFDGVTNALENVLLQEEGLSETALRILSGFIDDCEKNGVRFFAAYPSLFYDKAYLSERTRETIAAIEAFYASKNVPILGTFEDFLYPLEDIYDTRYHLNAEGREKRTRQMVELLKPYLPAKPEDPR